MVPNLKRLEAVVRANEARPDTGFDMTYVAHSCGTPACMLGGYAADHRQRTFKLLPNNGLAYYRADGEPVTWWGQPLERLGRVFGLDADQVIELFGADGENEFATRKFMIRKFKRFIAAERRRRAR